MPPRLDRRVGALPGERFRLRRHTRARRGGVLGGGDSHILATPRHAVHPRNGYGWHYPEPAICR
ncbi:hypothetical protein GCM10028790_29250 [Micromonospora taraxaci]